MQIRISGVYLGCKFLRDMYASCQQRYVTVLVGPFLFIIVYYNLSN